MGGAARTLQPWGQQWGRLTAQPAPSSHTTDLSLLLGLHPQRSSPGVLCSGASPQGLVWGHAQTQDSSHGHALTASGDVGTFGNSSSSLWQTNETREGNASHISEIQLPSMCLHLDGYRRILPTPVRKWGSEIKVNPSRFHRKAK